MLVPQIEPICEQISFSGQSVSEAMLEGTVANISYVVLML